MTPDKRRSPAGTGLRNKQSKSVRQGHSHNTKARQNKPHFTVNERRAVDAFYGAPDPRTALTSAGLSVSVHNNATHWVIEGHGLRLNHWPTKMKWRAFGRRWNSSVDAVIRAVRAGRFCMPADAKPGTCKRCEAPIWWVLNDGDRWEPIEADGDTHIARCRS